MICNGCGNKHAARIKIGYDDHNEKYEICDECGAAPVNPCPDVYLEPGKGTYRTNDNLCNEDGTPIPYSTKREKAAIMKSLGLRQADCAEKQGGMRKESYKRRKYFTF